MGAPWLHLTVPHLLQHKTQRLCHGCLLKAPSQHTAAPCLTEVLHSCTRWALHLVLQ